MENGEEGAPRIVRAAGRGTGDVGDEIAAYAFGDGGNLRSAFEQVREYSNGPSAGGKRLH